MMRSLTTGVLVFSAALFFLMACSFPLQGDKGGRSDRENIETGERLFNTHCSSCHRTDSEARLIGPGLKGILKRKTLAESGAPATPENIIAVLKSPVSIMPSFSHLSEDEMLDIIAYLNTL
jgi:mono/diheme cytochrome c family protein